MVQITFTCKTVSPMFIGNASTDKAELRPSAIKASMRFWWRAIHPNLSAEELRIAECKLFGGSYIPNKKKEDEKDKDDKTKNNAPQFRVLNFSTKLKTKRVKLDPRNDKHLKKEAIEENQIFDISYLCKSEESMETLIDLMHLSSTLGGLGNRSRRGAGAWKIINYEINKSKQADDKIEYDLNSILTIINRLNDNREKDENVYSISDGNILYNITQHLTKGGFPYLKKVELGENFEDEVKLRIKIMDTAHFYKGDHKSNDDKIKAKAKLFSEFLGNAMGKRLASPVYVSMINKDMSIINDVKKVKPIISTLNVEIEKNRNETDEAFKERKKTLINKGEELQDKFKTAILNNAEPKN